MHNPPTPDDVLNPYRFPSASGRTLDGQVWDGVPGEVGNG